MVIGGILDWEAVEALCRRVATLPRCGGELVCDVRAVARPDAQTVDALAHLQLVSKRAGLRLRVRGAGDELRRLVAFMGLEDVLSVEPGREPEQLEEPRRVEEEGDPPDLAAGDIENL